MTITPPIRPVDAAAETVAPVAPDANAAAVITSEQPEPVFIPSESLDDLEAQVTKVFQDRADQAAQRNGTNGVAPDGAADSTGAEAEAVDSPAVQAPAPVEVPPAVITPPIQPGTDAPGTATPPVAPAAAPALAQEGSGLPEPVPGYDPFALPAPPVQPAPQFQEIAGQPVPASAPTPIQPGYIDFLGEQIPVQQAEVIRNTYQWATSLQPEEANAINQFIEQRRIAQAQGQQPPAVIQPTPIQLVQPTQQPAVFPNQPQAFQQPQPPGSVALPPPPQIDPTLFDDPQLAAFLNQQQQWFAAQAQQQQQIIQQQQQQLTQVQQTAQSAVLRDVEEQQRQAMHSLNQANWDFAVKYNLQPAELDVVLSRLEQSQLLSPLVQRRNGDVYAAVTDGLETTYWTSPELRARAVAQQTAPAVADSRAIQARAAKVGKLGGSGGAVVETPAATPQQRHEGMVSALRTAMDQNPS